MKKLLTSYDKERLEAVYEHVNKNKILHTANVKRILNDNLDKMPNDGMEGSNNLIQSTFNDHENLRGRDYYKLSDENSNDKEQK